MSLRSRNRNLDVLKKLLCELLNNLEERTKPQSSNEDSNSVLPSVIRKSHVCNKSNSRKQKRVGNPLTQGLDLLRRKLPEIIECMHRLELKLSGISDGIQELLTLQHEQADLHIKTHMHRNTTCNYYDSKLACLANLEKRGPNPQREFAEELQHG